MPSIHQFRVEGLLRGVIDFATFAGRKILVVNVASACGYTSQYQQLQELYSYMQDRLVIVGFPCNDFGDQEPGTAEEIAAFCQTEYGVTFPLAKKVAIKPPLTHPVYQWLTRAALNGKFDSEVVWNFHKYLLDERGELLIALPPATDPLHPALLELVDA